METVSHISSSTRRIDPPPSHFKHRDVQIWGTLAFMDHGVSNGTAVEPVSVHTYAKVLEAVPKEGVPVYLKKGAQ